MDSRLASQNYGKTCVRLSRITRHADRHDFTELSATIALEGDFSAAYTDGDNRNVIPTDTMKNTVHVLAHGEGIDSIEGFSLRLARHFVDEYSQVHRASASIEEVPWSRMTVDGEPYPHAFSGGGGERRVCQAVVTPDDATLRSGLTGLRILKTTGSGFSGYHHDRYTTLQETEDRILASTIDAWWQCRDTGVDWTEARETIRRAMLRVFAEQYSVSVQATLYRMGSAALAVCPSIDEVSITMPNQHHLLVDLRPFGLDNENETFMPIDEPHGTISAVIRRSEASETS